MFSAGILLHTFDFVIGLMTSKHLILFQFLVSFVSAQSQTIPADTSARKTSPLRESHIIDVTTSLDTITNLYEHSYLFMDYRIGVTTNFVNSKTSSYYNPYWNMGFGTSLYIGNILASYCANPATLPRFKSTLFNTDGDTILEYRKKGGSSWTNIIKHNWDLGYEFRINEKSSITPTAGVSFWRYVIYGPGDDLIKIRNLHDFNVGLSYKRYVPVTNATRFFYGVQAYVIYSDVPNKFSALGNYYSSITVMCGFKFVPQGAILFSLLSNMDKLDY